MNIRITSNVIELLAEEVINDHSDEIVNVVDLYNAVNEVLFLHFDSIGLKVDEHVIKALVERVEWLLNN